MLSRRTLLASSATALAAATLSTAHAADWPERPVRVIVPYPPGGSTDILTRIIAANLQQYLPGRGAFVIENRSGAGGNIGADVACKATPDGYTLLSATIGTYAINPFLYARLSYDAQKDLDQVSLVYDMPNVAIVPTALPVNTLAEFIEWGKKQPNGIVYGSPGVGTTPHLSGVLFCQRTGLNNTHIPFRGAAETMPAMLRGDVHFAIDNLSSYIAAIRAGQLKALAITTAERWPTLNTVPTMKEAGMDDFVVTSWTNFAFPTGTPRPIQNLLGRALAELAKNPAHQQQLLEIGARALSSTPDETVAFSNRERTRWREIVQVSGARMD